MLEKLIILCLGLVLLIPVMSVHAFTGDVELVVDNVGISPASPKNGEMVSITAEIHNLGSKNTRTFTSMITAAYFVDGDLLHIDEIGNIKPGASNKITIASPPVWKSENGVHDVKVIIDYHDTLNDQYDSPTNNSINKNLLVMPVRSTDISVEASPQYLLQGEKMSRISVSLLDSDSFEFLNDKEIALNFDDNDFVLLTDDMGMISFSNALSSHPPVKVIASFGGDEIYSSSSSSLILYQFPSEVSSALVLKLSDSNLHDFENNSFEIVIYQDTYEKPIKKIRPDSATLFDSETFWISLPFGHHYFAEVYLDGRIFSVTDKKLLQEYGVVVQKINVPEMGKIKFTVVDEMGRFVTDSKITNWIYTYSAEDGFTDWVDVIPVLREPYVAKATLIDGRVINSEPFVVYPGEQKIIEILTSEKTRYDEIPSWVKANAGWWADGSIDDSSFVEGMQFLIREQIVLVPETTSNFSQDYDEIPSWVKANAGWWADGSIDDSSFVEGMQFLIREGLIKLF